MPEKNISEGGGGVDDSGNVIGGVAPDDSSTSVHPTSETKDINSTAVGNSSISSQDAIAVGTGATANNLEAICIGKNSGTSYNRSTAIGVGSSASLFAVGIGHGASAGERRAISLGKNADAQRPSSIAIGGRSASTTSKSIALGDDASGGGESSISIGYSSNASGAFNIAIGENESNSVGDTAQIRGNVKLDRTFVDSANTTAYTTTTKEEVVGIDTNSASVTVTLDSTSAGDQGHKIIIKDEGGNAGTNGITIDTAGTETIDGASSTSITSNFGSITVYSDGTNWYGIGSVSSAL